MTVSDDRDRGLMEGIAVGNLLGIAMEGMPKDEVRRRYPNGVTEIEARVGYPDDDDLAQAIIIAEASAAGPLDVDDLGARFWAWGEENGLGMGLLTHDVLTRYGGALPRCLGRAGGGDARPPAGMPILEASREAWGGNRAGNGALMRCAPIAVRWRDDPAANARNSVVSAVPTHWDPRCGWSCALLDLAAAAALRGETLGADELMAQAESALGASTGELSRYGYDAVMPEEVRAAVQRAAAESLSDLEIDGGDSGYTLVTLRTALTAWWTAESFDEGLRAIVEAGGDTDTNGAAAGALLGAR
ncbi:MAG: ADP-ribosylglycohydrolase family protein, partial [Chloroflexota bacterium]|nr:ADP-ribosylglycohydrolase family protein [Chloroflexota bacterium]